MRGTAILRTSNGYLTVYSLYNQLYIVIKSTLPLYYLLNFIALYLSPFPDNPFRLSSCDIFRLACKSVVYPAMRLPYTENPPKNLSEEDEQILERVKARRGEKGLIPLDLALLHAPKVADGT